LHTIAAMAREGKVLLIDGEPAALRLATAYLGKLFNPTLQPTERTGRLLVDGVASDVVILEYRRAAAEPAPALDDPRMESVARHIHDRYAERLSVNELARRARMSRSRLSRRFKAYFRVSIRTYISTFRITRAGRLLEESDLSITEIALKAGFYDLPRFDKVFRRIIGMSPSAYRQLHLQSQKRQAAVT
jgi:transcriptional regulator GlxA family with amidase domain